VAAAIAPPPAGSPPLHSVPDSADAPQHADAAEATAPDQPTDDEPPPPQRADGAALDLRALREAWPAVLDALRGEKAFVASCLENAVPITLADGVLTAAFSADDAFIRRKCEEEPASTAVAQAIHEVTGARVRVVYELREAAELGLVAPVSTQAPDEDAMLERLKAELDATEILPDVEPGPDPPD
ncbi:MAG: hypothetical protein M3459_01620, partial [Actinomycetota bacterium]|nr:hypothetical protein [Actinomycetota bacterium]